jgi:hypothetical protein
MEETTKETTTTKGTPTLTPNNREASSSLTVERLVYFLFGILEVLLAFRLIFKLAGASLASGFVEFVYGLSGIFILPFEGIFRRAVAPGIETKAVLEPSTLVAIIVYAVLAWGVVKLIRILSGNRQIS